MSWYLGQLGYDWNHVLDGSEAMGLVVLASAWGRISYNFLFFFAALQAVPRSVIEAAAIDGAHFWRRFFTIVLPLISPTTFFLLVVNVIYTFLRLLVLSTQLPLVGHSNRLQSSFIRFFQTGLLAKIWIIISSVCDSFVRCRSSDCSSVQIY